MFAKVKTDFHPVLHCQEFLVQNVLTDPLECGTERNGGFLVKNSFIEKQTKNKRSEVWVLFCTKDLSEVEVLRCQFTKVKRSVSVDSD